MLFRVCVLVRKKAWHCRAQVTGAARKSQVLREIALAGTTHYAPPTAVAVPYAHAIVATVQNSIFQPFSSLVLALLRRLYCCVLFMLKHRVQVTKKCFLRMPAYVPSLLCTIFAMHTYLHAYGG